MTKTEFQRWLFRIAENKMVKAMGRFHARACPPKLRSTHFLTAQQAMMDRTADRQLMLTEQTNLLLRSIAALPDDIRGVILLGYTRELSFSDIACQLDMTETTCRRRWFEGLQLLAELMR